MQPLVEIFSIFIKCFFQSVILITKFLFFSRYSVVGQLWTSCRQNLSSQLLALYSKGRVHGLKKTCISICKFIDHRQTGHPFLLAPYTTYYLRKIRNIADKICRQDAPSRWTICIGSHFFIRAIPFEPPLRISNGIALIVDNFLVAGLQVVW